MAYDTSKLVSLESLKTAVNRIKSEYLSAISKAGHARFESAAVVPDTETAQENILYFVKDEESGLYNVYAKIEGEVVNVVSPNADGSDYVTEKELQDAIKGLSSGGGSVYSGTKTSLEADDNSVIQSFFGGEDAPTPAKGDVFVITTIVGEVEYEKTAYWYDGESWTAFSGNVDADKVIMQDNITMAGDYTQVGNKTKTQNGTEEFTTKGKSVAEILTEIFSKRLQPTITAQPSVSGFNLSGAKAVEAGTQLPSVNYTDGTLNPGSYKYGPETGVVATNWKVERVTDLSAEEIVDSDAASLEAGSDDNSGAGFVIGDSGGEGVISSLKYRAVATHGAGVTAHDNLGDDSSPAVAIEASTKSKETASYTPYRNYFYGTSTNKPELSSNVIRALTPSNKAYAPGVLTINVPAGTVRIVIACEGTKTGVTKVINETAMNADVTDTFEQQIVEVEGANGYASKNYNVWLYEPAVPYENAATLKVTLG